MKLCISIACYRWAFQPSIRRDGPEYRAGGGPLAYLQSFEAPPPEDNRFFWMVDKTAELGLQGLYAHPGEYVDDRAGAEAMRRKVEDRGLIWNGGLTVNMAATDDEWESFEYANAVRQLKLNHWAGLNIATMTHRLPNVHNHFSTDPPIAEQMARAAKHLPTLTPVAEELGVIMAWENHMDYQVAEVAGVVDEISSPWLRITLDTSNPFPSLEDPLEGARIAARNVVAVHFKDFRAQPLRDTWEPHFHYSPVGHGDSPIGEILALLQAEAPDPANLLANIEISPPPQHDPEAWVLESKRWLLEEQGQYFEPHLAVQ